MVYECEHCGYTTTRKANFSRHKKRKNSCNKVIDGNANGLFIKKLKIAQNEENVTQNEENVAQNEENVAQNEENVAQKRIKYVCYKCSKSFCNKRSLLYHRGICKGVGNLTCPTCFKTFENRSKKCRHKKAGECRRIDNIENNPLLNFSTINNTTNNNTVNNTNCNNQNIQINVFGGEDLSYLTNDKGILHRLRMYGKEGIYGLPKIIDDVHFNKERPENQTIIKPEEYGNTVLIKNDNNEWELREFEDVRDDMIGTIIKYFKAYNEVKKKQKIKLVEEKERRFIKTISYELMALDGCIPKDLFHELDMEDEIVEEDEIEIKNKTRKFDKCTMHTIHNRTTSGYKKENGSYIKK